MFCTKQFRFRSYCHSLRASWATTPVGLHGTSRCAWAWRWWVIPAGACSVAISWVLLKTTTSHNTRFNKHACPYTRHAVDTTNRLCGSLLHSVLWTWPDLAAFTQRFRFMLLNVCMCVCMFVCLESSVQAVFLSYSQNHCWF